MFKDRRESLSVKRLANVCFHKTWQWRLHFNFKCFFNTSPRQSLCTLQIKRQHQKQTNGHSHYSDINLNNLEPCRSEEYFEFVASDVNKSIGGKYTTKDQSSNKDFGCCISDQTKCFHGLASKKCKMPIIIPKYAISLASITDEIWKDPPYVTYMKINRLCNVLGIEIENG